MSEAVMLSALQAITEGRSALGDLIGAAMTMSAAGQPRLSEQLYKVWIAFNPNHPQSYVALFNLSALQGEAGDAAGSEAGVAHSCAANPTRRSCRRR